MTISLLLALGVLIVLTDAIDMLRRRTDSYTVVFDIASGVPNIKRGSQVRVGGVNMGRVTEIERGPQTAGAHQASWNFRDASGRSVPLGYYILKLRAGDTVLTRRVIRVT